MEKLLAESNALKQIPLPEYRRLFYAELPWDNACTAILGPRGVGKTTLLLQRLQALDLPAERAIYVDLGDLYFSEHRLYDFARQYADQGGAYLLIDEVHRYPLNSWATEMKLIYDRLRTKLKVVFTGSSLLKIINEQADLSRRVLFFHLAGLSFREYLLLRHEVSLPQLALKNLLGDRESYLGEHRVAVSQINLGWFADYLQRGYYPYFLEEPIGYLSRINTSVQLVLAADIAHAPGHEANDVGKLARLLAAIASSAPFKPNLSKLAERVGMSRNLLVTYLTALEKANLIMQLRAESKGIAALGKPDRVFLDNTNLIYALSPQRSETGTIRETFFLNQLRHLTRTTELLPPEISLPKQGDFVYRHGEDRYVFEIGGPNKTARQVREAEHHFVVADELVTGGARRIPLWMFGLLY